MSLKAAQRIESQCNICRREKEAPSRRGEASLGVLLRARRIGGESNIEEASIKSSRRVSARKLLIELIAHNSRSGDEVPVRERSREAVNTQRI